MIYIAAWIIVGWFVLNYVIPIAFLLLLGILRLLGAPFRYASTSTPASAEPEHWHAKWITEERPALTRQSKVALVVILGGGLGFITGIILRAAYAL